MSAALRETKTGSGFDETKLLAFLDAVLAPVASIDRDRRRRWGSTAAWAMRASPGSFPGGPRKAIEEEVTHGRGGELPKDQREWLTMKALNLTCAFPIMAGGSWWGL